MADPFPEERVMFVNVHPVMVEVQSVCIFTSGADSWNDDV